MDSGGKPPPTGVPAGHPFLKAAINTVVRAGNNTIADLLVPESMTTLRATSGPGAITGAWNGGAWVEPRLEMHLVANGGHGDYWGNEHFVFNATALRWEMRRGPTLDFSGWDLNSNTLAFPSDGLPVSRHTYGGVIYNQKRNEILLLGGSLASGSGQPGDDRWSIPLDGSTPVYRGGEKSYFLGWQTAYDSANDRVIAVRNALPYVVGDDFSLTRIGQKSWNTVGAIESGIAM
ncbi:MAG: hypothetical protein ACK5HY_06835, partial [Parahaliea sp.]